MIIFNYVGMHVRDIDIFKSPILLYIDSS